MEWTMQQQGFDYACDKRLYDRLRRCATTPCATATGSCSKCAPAWEGNWTWDCFLVFSWQGAGDERLVVTVNYAPNQSQCHVRLPFADLANSRWRLKDLLGDATYDWNGSDLQARGLYLDERPWSARVFALTKV
jgi:hypothetical protein